MEMKALGQPTHATHPHIINKGEITSLTTRSEYKHRRFVLIDQIKSHAKKMHMASNNHLIVVPASSTQYMSGKIPYNFRQNTDFLYLTGCLEPDCCFVTTIINEEFSTTLFTRETDKNAEKWDGPRTNHRDAADFFGVNQSLPINVLNDFIRGFVKYVANLIVWYNFVNPIQMHVHSIMENFMSDFGTTLTCENPTIFIQQMRLIKSPSEVALMRKTCRIASDAFIETIKCSSPGIIESQLNAKFDFECKIRGAENMAYPPIIAGGKRACIIHYSNNNQVLSKDDVVLMDGGCEYHGYCSDITRTWPVGGAFSPEQKSIYKIVYEANCELIDMCKSFPSLDALYERMLITVGVKLQHLGLLSRYETIKSVMKVAQQLCPHHCCHFLGMDVHDTPMIKRSIKMRPGMIITVEPGIYINEENTLFPKNYRGIGVRIEDDVLITETGPVVLSDFCPKDIEQIEKLASEFSKLPSGYI
ncbi:unnamed protein product [Phyllotreta striolata]|uniref:Aminopeptidase P N-terminal domain-containing protein n=1 Tax=Phyllotreta striolata TaxID=444603 RepID=A0A9N9TKS4_PHYSR|nr:unnamed protein product [Phyllotreta striolata]